MNKNVALIKKTFCCLLLTLATFSSNASNKVAFYVEPPIVNIQRLGTNAFDSEFKKTDSGTLNFGFLDHAVWLRITVAKGIGEKFLQLDLPSLQFLELYALSKSGAYTKRNFKQDSAGKPNLRDHRTFLFDFPQNQQSKTKYYIKLKGSANLFLKYSFLDEKEFIAKSNNDYLFIGIHLGLMLILALYNVGQYWLTNEKTYLYCVFFVLSLGLNFVFVSGVLGQYVIGDHILFSRFFLSLSKGLVLLSGLIITSKTMELKIYSPRIYFLFKAVFIITMAQIIFSFVTGSTISYILGRYFEIGVPAFLFYFSIFIALNGDKSARWLTLVWGVFVTSLIISVSMDSGLLPENLFRYFGITFGSAAAAVLISWTLTVKFFEESRQSFSGHLDKGGNLSSQIKELEAKIEDNEKEISQHNEIIGEKDQEIEYNLKRLREQSVYDKLTRLLNYSSFIVQFNRFYHDASRYHYPVAVILIDLDKFKNINDTFGLDAGNEVLKAVAEVLQQDCRNTDLIARYGDDEFIFLMTHSTKENAVIKGEQIIKKIHSISLKTHPDLAASASVGITMMGSGGGGYSHDTRSIIDKAKKALSQAKAEGGGQVRIFTKADE